MIKEKYLKRKKGRMIRAAMATLLIVALVPSAAFADDKSLGVEEKLVLQDVAAETNDSTQSEAVVPVSTYDILEETAIDVSSRETTLASDELPAKTNFTIVVEADVPEGTQATLVVRKEHNTGEIERTKTILFNTPEVIEDIEVGIYHLEILEKEVLSQTGSLVLQKENYQGLITGGIELLVYGEDPIAINEDDDLLVTFMYEVVEAEEEKAKQDSDTEVPENENETIDKENGTPVDEDKKGELDPGYFEYDENGNIRWSSRLGEDEALSLLESIWSSPEDSDISSLFSLAEEIMPLGAGDVYIGQVLTGTCNIGGHSTSGGNSTFDVTFGDASFTGSMTLWCLDPGAAEPYPQSAPYTATVTDIDYATGIVTYSIYITPADVWDGVSYANGKPAGYQHVGGLVGVWRDLDPGRLYIQKVDEDTGLPSPSGNASFENAVYTVKGVTDPTYQEDIVLNALGRGLLDRMPLGDYTAVETVAPKGYELNPQVYSFTIGDPASGLNVINLTVSDKVKKSSIEVQKNDMKTGIGVPNTEFEAYIYTGDDVPSEYHNNPIGMHTAYDKNPFTGVDLTRWKLVDAQVTDASGSYIWTDKVYGYYLIHESKPNPEYAAWWETEGTSWPWYVVFIDGTEPQVQIFENEAISVECNVTKSTIARTSAAFKSPYDSFTNVGKERYPYTVGFDNGKTNVYAEEYTVVDKCEFTTLGLRLDQLWTPVIAADTDLDGTYNLKYRTNFSNGNSAVDAKRSNPKNKLSDGSSRIDAAGYHDWAVELSCYERVLLNVADLNLADGEYITELALEFGGVNPGFSTATPLQYNVYASHALEYNQDNTVIPNTVTSHITRNWFGGNGLHDDAFAGVETRVVDTMAYPPAKNTVSGQGTPAKGPQIPKTGDNALIFVIVSCLIIAALTLIVISRKRMATEMPATESDDGSCWGPTTMQEAYFEVLEDDLCKREKSKKTEIANSLVLRE